MTRLETTTKSLRFGKFTESASKSVKALAEAGAKGQALTPAEVKRICEELRSQQRRTRTQFHSGT